MRLSLFCLCLILATVVVIMAQKRDRNRGGSGRPAGGGRGGPGGGRGPGGGSRGPGGGRRGPGGGGRGPGGGPGRPIHAPSGGRPMRGRMVMEFVRMTTGRFNNDQLVAQQAEDNAPMNERVPPMTNTVVPVDIRSVSQPAMAVFVQSEVVQQSGERVRIPVLQLFDSITGNGGNTVIRNRLWKFKNPTQYLDGWKNPSIFADLELTEGESEELIYEDKCDTTSSRSADGGSFSSNGYSPECLVPLSDQVSHQPISHKLTPRAMAIEAALVSLADGSIIANIKYELDKVSRYPTGPMMAKFLQMVVGGYNNDKQVKQEAQNNVETGQRNPSVKYSIWPIQIDALPPHIRATYARGVFTLGPNTTMDLAVIETFQEAGDEASPLLRQLVYKFKDPSKFIDVTPSSLTSLDMSEDSDDVTTSEDCVTFWSQATDDGGFTANGTSASCFFAMAEQRFFHPGVYTLTTSRYTGEATLHSEIGGPAIKSLQLVMDKVSAHPSQPAMTFTGIRDALMSGRSGHYRLPLSECTAEETESDGGSTLIIGGPIDDFEHIPAGAFGPVGYLRIAREQMVVKPDGSGFFRMTSLNVYETGSVSFIVSRISVDGDVLANPISRKLYNCTLLSQGPQGPLPALTFHKPRHFQVLPSAGRAINALRRGQRVRVAVDLMACQKGDESAPNIMTEAGALIEDYDVTEAEPGSQVLTFTKRKTSPSVCSDGTMTAGVYGTVQEATNTVSLLQWGGSNVGPRNPCFGVFYTCPVADGSENSRGATFFLV